MHPGSREYTFLGNKFICDERAYLPNLETELLAKYAISLTKPNDLVVDVGTGSANIAISIAKRVPTATIYATDIDPRALKVAEENVRRHNVKNVFIQRSCYLDDLDIPAPNLIVSDLPWGDENHLLETSTPEHHAAMPPISLFHDKGIMGAYTELLESIQKKGWRTICIFETGVMTKEEVSLGIPHGLEWEYIPHLKYSITKVVF